VGTYDKDGKPNGMTAAWGGICCSKPPCFTVAEKEYFGIGRKIGDAFSIGNGIK